MIRTLPDPPVGGVRCSVSMTSRCAAAHQYGTVYHQGCRCYGKWPTLVDLFGSPHGPRRAADSRLGKIGMMSGDGGRPGWVWWRRVWMIGWWS
jgi:hypothetical protein